MTEIIVAIIGLIGLIAQSSISANTSKKIKSNEAREKEIDNKLSAMEKRLIDKIEDTKLNSNKRFLVDFMHRCEKGEEFSDEETKYAFEAKAAYNKLGGNSYVDTKWDMLIKKGILKLVEEVHNEKQ
jgi:hypothetical protein